MSRTYPKPNEIMLNDFWSGYDGKWNERPIIVLYRPHLEHLEGHPCYAKRLHVIWEYGDDGESGMPEPDEDLKMNAFGDRLSVLLERRNHAILVAEVTHAGSREWIFYSQDVDGSVHRVNNAFRHEPRKPLALEAVDDPDWAEYLGIVTNFGSSSSEA